MQGSNRVKERGEEMEGLGGAVESPEVPWRHWPTTVVFEVEHFLFLDDFSILCIFCRFWLHFV